MPGITGEHEEHESYGVITFSRASGHHTLFGSSIEHDHVVMVEINTADVSRHLSQDWVHSGKYLIRAVMSTSQFADAITSLNNGPGTPITLEYVVGDEHRREAPPAPNKRKQFESELSEALQKPMTMLNEMIAKAKTRAQKRELETLRDRMKSSLPFMQDQFVRQMDKTVNEAKAEFEAFTLHRERDAGIRFLAGETDDASRYLPAPEPPEPEE